MPNPLKLAAMRWAYASVHGIRVQIPWDTNEPQYGKYHFAYSKGSRHALIAFAEGNCPHRSKWAIERWMKGENPQEIHVGIDCSGFVYRVLDEACRMSGAPPLVQTLGTACEYTALDTLTPLHRPIARADQVRAGDTFRFNKGRHSGVVIEVVTGSDGRLSEIWYAHSSFTRGPHIGWIEVGNPAAPLNAKSQSWHDQMWDRLNDNNLRDIYFTSAHHSDFYQGPRPRVAKRTGLTVRVGAEPVSFTLPPFILGGTTLCQIRPLAEALGAVVRWEGSSQTVTFELNGRQARCQVGSEVGAVNGRGYLLEEPPTLVNDSVVVPIRFVAEALGYQVRWEEDASRITLIRL